jgi:hypothetical protein
MCHTRRRNEMHVCWEFHLMSTFLSKRILQLVGPTGTEFWWYVACSVRSHFKLELTTFLGKFFVLLAVFCYIVKRERFLIYCEIGNYHAGHVSPPYFTLSHAQADKVILLLLELWISLSVLSLSLCQNPSVVPEIPVTLNHSTGQVPQGWWVR